MGFLMGLMGLMGFLMGKHADFRGISTGFLYLRGLSSDTCGGLQLVPTQRPTYLVELCEALEHLTSLI